MARVNTRRSGFLASAELASSVRSAISSLATRQAVANVSQALLGTNPVRRRRDISVVDDNPAYVERRSRYNPNRKCRFYAYGSKACLGVVLELGNFATLQDVFELLDSVGMRPQGYLPRAVYTTSGDAVKDANRLTHGISYFVTSGRAPHCFDLVPSAVFEDFIDGCGRFL